MGLNELNTGKDYIDAFKFGFNNYDTIVKSKKCGCYYCLAEYEPSKITDFIHTDKENTAVCPECGIDSVVGDASGYDINNTLLSNMHKFYFDSMTAEEIDIILSL